MKNAREKTTASSAPLMPDAFSVGEILRLSIMRPVSALASTAKQSAQEALIRKRARDRDVILRFVEGIDWEELEENMEQLQELQMIVNKRNEDEISEALGRVIHLLEDLTDTVESCKLK